MLAHGVSRGNVFKPDKLRSSERRQDLRKSSAAPPGLFPSPTFTHGSRRGLTSIAAPQLLAALSLCQKLRCARQRHYVSFAIAKTGSAH